MAVTYGYSSAILPMPAVGVLSRVKPTPPATLLTKLGMVDSTGMNCHVVSSGMQLCSATRYGPKLAMIGRMRGSKTGAYNTSSPSRKLNSGIAPSRVQPMARLTGAGS